MNAWVCFQTDTVCYNLMLLLFFSRCGQTFRQARCSQCQIIYRHSQQPLSHLTCNCHTPRAPRLSPTTAILTTQKQWVICHLQGMLALNNWMRMILRQWDTNPSSPRTRILSIIPWTNSSSSCTLHGCGGRRAFSWEMERFTRETMQQTADNSSWYPSRYGLELVYANAVPSVFRMNVV